MDLLERYKAGENERVWMELRQLGDRVREPTYLSTAQAICDEMARRARQNIETLVARLVSHGYSFHNNNDAQTPCEGFIPATAKAADRAQWFDDQPFGPIPLVLSSWIRLVGDVWLVGSHPDWPEAEEADPLVVQIEGTHHPNSPIIGYFADEYENWQEWADEDPQAAGCFSLPVAPDRLTKANISGGPPYGFLLPDSCADALFCADQTVSFVSYLNSVFSEGGFASPDAGHWQLRRELSRDLLRL